MDEIKGIAKDERRKVKEKKKRKEEEKVGKDSDRGIKKKT